VGIKFAGAVERKKHREEGNLRMQGKSGIAPAGEALPGGKTLLSRKTAAF